MKKDLLRPSTEAKGPDRSWMVREGTPEDMAGILECRKTVFTDEDLEKQTPEYWRYAFIDNHAGRARFFVAVDGSRIVGYYAVVPQDFILADQRLAGSIVVDVMTHPEYRFQGMFTAIGRFAINACSTDSPLAFTTGYPIRPEVLPGHLKVGWKARFKIGTYVVPLVPSAILRRKLKYFGSLPGAAALAGFFPALAFRAWSRFWCSGASGFSVSRSSRSDPGQLEEFWKRFRLAVPPDCLLQERSSEYLRWRYDENPGRNYMFHIARDPEGEVCGFYVTREARLLSVGTRAIVDACCIPSAGLEVFRALTADVRALAESEGSALVALMVTQPDPLFPPPWRFGFIPAPYRFTFITREFKNPSVIDSNALRWHLMWGDTDDL